MKSNRIVTSNFAKDMATTAKGCAAVISSIGLMALLFLFMAVSSAEAQTLQFTFPTTRVTVPVNSSNVVTIAINNTANTNGLGVRTNGMTLGGDGFYHIDPVNLNVSGLPDGATYNITDPNGVVLTQIGNGNNGYETNNYHTNLLVNLFCTNVAQGIYTFYLNAGGTNGLPTNNIPLVLQAAHIWNGNGGIEASFGVSNNWTNAASWLGGAPGALDDVVIGDFGGQTNTYDSGISFTNIGVSSNITVASIRFASTVYTNLDSTNALAHTIQIASNATLFVTGTNGFSLLRDYIGAFGDPMALIHDRPDRPMIITIVGTNAALWVSNSAANFIMLHGSANATANNPVNTLNMTNLDRFVCYVSQMGLAEYQLFPNYAGLNKAYNGGAGDTNEYTMRPNNLAANVYLARTNFITATYKDPNNYANENRTYALSFEDSEQQGLGGAPSTTLLLGATNRFLLDSVAFVRANHQGFVRFAAPNSGAVFRGTNGTDRLSVFAISDDGGSTNMANSNVKATVDFAGNSGLVDILADRLYIARDRTLIASNQTPNVQGDLLIGKGNVDVNTAVLGFQEHSNKTDWTAFNSTYQAYLNYCQGRLIVTNGGTFKVNRTLTLGYTADNNPSSSAQQYNTFGRVTVYAGSTVIASNIVCDTGLNFYDPNKRQNTITLDAGTLLVTNSIGGSSANANVAGNLAGLPLDTLTMRNGATLTLFVTPGRTNVYVRTLTCEGSTPDTIKIGSLATNGLSYPTNLPIISYETATPLLQANMTNVTGVQGYILNDAGNKVITLYLTTNAPKTLLWTGSADNNWDLTTKNWVPVGGGAATSFALGDIVTFDDTSAVTNINVTLVVTPGQMTVSNVARQYTFTANGGAIAGTAQLVKVGTNSLAMNVSDGQTMLLKEGTVTGSGSIGGAVIYSNGVPNVLDFSGAINGSVASTNSIVSLEFGSSINSGTVTINGGVFVNAGTVTLPSSGTSKFMLTNNAVATNTADGIIYLGPGNPAAVVYNDCTLANFGMINTYGNGSAGGRLLVYGLYFGTGTIYDPLGGTSSNSGRLAEQDTLDAVISPGATPSGSIGNMNAFVRFDPRANNNSSNPDGKLLIEVDQAGTVNDTITCDKWNNLGNIWVMTNLDNASFSAGQIFHVLINTVAGFPNATDTGLSFPLMWPPVPGPGLQWNISRLQTWGDVMVTNSAMIWDGASSTSWDTNGVNLSWKNSKAFTNNMGAIFDERASAFNVHVTTTVAPAGFNVVNTTNIVIGVSTNITITTNFPSFMPGIVVSNSTDEYVMDGTGKISGMAGIYKTGPGTLTMLGSNDFTGGIIVDGGTLAITNRMALGATAGGAGYQQIILNDCTLKFFGVANTNEGYNYVTINEKGATVEVSSSAAVFRMDSNIQGPGALTKTGLGTLGLGNGKVNVYKGGTTLSEGTLQLMSDGAAGVGANLNIANGTVLQLTNKSGVTITNTINFAGDALVQEINPTRFVSGGKWIGSGTVTISNAVGDSFFFSAALTNYSGVISLGNSSGSYLFNNSTNKSPCLGSALATFDLGTSTATLSNFNGGALTYDLGGLAGGAGTILAGRATNNVTTNAATTYSIGAKGNDTTFSGKIVNGVDDVVTVVKVGSGRLLLNGASTYTGGTTVSNGILGGTGSIAGNLTVAPGGTLSPGASIGTFTVGGNATLNGTVFMELNRTNTPATNDLLVVTGTITAPGALVVTNVGPDIYNGSTFKLFSKGITFGSVQLPAKDPTGTRNYVWDQSNLPGNGTITLTSGGANLVNTTPTNITFSVSGSALTLSWPADHIGWQLWSNSVSLTSPDMWFQIAGSAATNQMIFTLDPAKTNVFFRLLLP